MRRRDKCHTGDYEKDALCRRKRARRIRRALLVALCAGAMFLFFKNNLESVILDMANARAGAMAVSYINSAVQEQMLSGVTYEELMNVRTDNQGRVTLIQANTVRMNQLAVETAQRAQDNLESVSAQYVKVPLGSALKVPFLAAVGPSVTVRVVPVGAVSAAFYTEFESAGINQTRHKIYLKLTAVVRLVIPTGAKNVQVESHVLIAESIVVGLVPDSYVEVPTVEDTLNFAANGP